jgi:hypothetical protein
MRKSCVTTVKVPIILHSHQPLPVCPRGVQKDGTEFPLQPLHHLCNGLLRHLCLQGHPTLDIYKDSLFAEFRSSTLDAKMKHLQRLGTVVEEGELLSEEEEEALWQRGVLGDHTP